MVNANINKSNTDSENNETENEEDLLKLLENRWKTKNHLKNNKQNIQNLIKNTKGGMISSI